jgi:hypothetical protein
MRSATRGSPPLPPVSRCRGWLGWWLLWAAVALAGLVGCTPDETETLVPLDAGQAGCAPGELTLDDGQCLAAGIAPEACGEGFEADGQLGCQPVLPGDACADGQVAWLGDTACGELQACGSSTFGDIPVDAATQYVDLSYAGGNSDGSALRPWTTVQDGIDAATAGAIVAVAAGNYHEDVEIMVHPVRLWGRCPALVTLEGTGAEVTTLMVRGTQANGSEIRGLALTGPGVGLIVTGAQEVVVERIWAHDTGDCGVSLEDTAAATSVAWHESLVERATGQGVFVFGAEAEIEALEVRSTQSLPDGTWGRALEVESDPGKHSAAILHLRRSVLDANRDMGMFLLGAQADLDGCLIRATDVRVSDGQFGVGIQMQPEPTENRPSQLDVQRTVLQANYGGIMAYGGQASIAATVVRDSAEAAATASHETARGINAQDDPASLAPATVTVRSSVIAANAVVGIVASASTISLEATIVRQTHANAAGQFGMGLALAPNPANMVAARGTVRGCVLEGNVTFGAFATGSDLVLEDTIVRDTTSQPLDGLFGDGVQTQSEPATGAQGSATVRRCLIEHNQGFGVSAIESNLTLDQVAVLDTRALDNGSYGDGVASASSSLTDPAIITITGSTISGSARAGIAAFGGEVRLGTSAIECNVIDIDGEPFEQSPFTLTDLGGNACGCSDTVRVCQVVSAGLTPPEAAP